MSRVSPGPQPLGRLSKQPPAPVQRPPCPHGQPSPPTSSRPTALPHPHSPCLGGPPARPCGTASSLARASPGQPCPRASSGSRRPTAQCAAWTAGRGCSSLCPRSSPGAARHTGAAERAPGRSPSRRAASPSGEAGSRCEKLGQAHRPNLCDDPTQGSQRHSPGLAGNHTGPHSTWDLVTPFSADSQMTHHCGLALFVLEPQCPVRTRPGSWVTY